MKSIKQFPSECNHIIGPVPYDRTMVWVYFFEKWHWIAVFKIGVVNKNG